MEKTIINFTVGADVDYGEGEAKWHPFMSFTATTASADGAAIVDAMGRAMKTLKEAFKEE